MTCVHKWIPSGSVKYGSAINLLQVCQKCDLIRRSCIHDSMGSETISTPWKIITMSKK